jgi:hypothetical protein
LDENHGKISGNQKSDPLLPERYAQGFFTGPIKKIRRVPIISGDLFRK